MTPEPTPEALRTSRRKLLAFAGFVLLTAFAFVASGFYMRSWLRGLGGVVTVEIENTSGKRVRADIYVGVQFTTLEMDAGESGTIRYNPPAPSKLQVNLFENNNKTAEFVGRIFEPGHAAKVKIIVDAVDNAAITYE